MLPNPDESPANRRLQLYRNRRSRPPHLLEVLETTARNLTVGGLF